MSAARRLLSGSELTIRAYTASATSAVGSARSIEAITVHFYTFVGVPVSTSQAVIGAVIGIARSTSHT